MIKIEKNSLQTLDIASTFSSLFLLIAGVCFLTYASEISIPLQPIPITMQTLAVSLIGAAYGWRLGMTTLLAFLVQHFLRMPTFSLYNIETLFNFHTGYLFSFPIMAALIGWILEKNKKNTFPLIRIPCALFCGHALCLFLGAMWLSIFIGVEKGFMLGFVPFIFVELIKIAIGTIILLSCLGWNHLLSKK